MIIVKLIQNSFKESDEIASTLNINQHRTIQLPDFIPIGLFFIKVRIIITQTCPHIIEVRGELLLREGLLCADAGTEKTSQTDNGEQSLMRNSHYPLSFN